MFTKPVAEAETKVDPSPNAKLALQPSTLLARPFGNGAGEWDRRIQRNIGNQAVLRLLGSHNEPGAAPANLTARTASPGASGDLGKTPIFPFDRRSGSQARPPLTAPPSLGVSQPKFDDGQPAPSEPGPAAPATAPAPPEPAPAPPEAAPAAPTAGTETSGRIADIMTPEGQGRATGEENAADAPMPLGPGNVVANIGLTLSQPKTDRPNGSKLDPVVSGVAVGPLSQPGGRAVSPFGGEFYEPAFVGTSYAFAAGKCTITSTLNVICPWGTSAGGRTDVPSATSPVVTAAKWPAIKADLAPGAASPFKSPRVTYYSQSLLDRHEKFHGTDDFGWTTGSGIGIVKTFLEAGTVASASAAADVPALVNGARVKLIAENTKWYKGGGASHDAYAGEIRAYADGRPLYQALADAVEAHGRTLAAPPAAPAPAVPPAAPAPAAPPAP